MQFKNLYARTVALIFLCTLSVCACKTAQHRVAVVPPPAAPALKPAPAATPGPAPETQQEPVFAEDQKARQEKDGAAGKQANPDNPIPPFQLATDPVGDLIAKVEAEYQRGLANYHAGKTEQAKRNFDNALNALLGSNFDIRSDDRLEKEFDRIVGGVNGIYPGGTAANAAQEQQKPEPAPIDVTNGIAPTADARTIAKAAAEIKNTHSDLPLMMTDQVAGYINYFSGYGRGVFERAYARSGRYHEMMVAELKKQGLPQDLIYLAQAESGFLPHAMSRVGARGIWQFMADRGLGYGLHRNLYVDDRQDPEKSTHAAARHLKDLYNEFGDWYLAMAAYNSGPGTVQAAVKRTGYADFWELYRRNVLPKETRNYVPIILAVTIMAKNPSQYGLESVAMEKPDHYDTITISDPVDLRLVADCIHASTSELEELNPSLLRLSTPREGKFELHLPAGTKDQYETAIASIPPGLRLWWRYHTVHPGDTVASLAHVYHTTAKQIEEANHLDGPELEGEAHLVIPVAPGKYPSDSATYARRITRYRVRRGDTVESVAENFGISALQLRRWNGIRGDSLAGRRVLALHLPISPSVRESELASSRTTRKSAPASTGAGSRTETATAKLPAAKSSETEPLRDKDKEELAVVHHKVRAGETLYSIATFYKTTVAALKRDNRNISVIRPGMILIVETAR